MTEFKCSLGTFKTNNFDDVISHSVHKHSLTNGQLNIWKRNNDSKAYKRLIFPIVPDDEHEKGKTIHQMLIYIYSVPISTFICDF